MKHVIVTTAVPLTPELHKEVTQTIAKKFSFKEGDYSLKEIVDPEVLGGISVTVDSRQYDATVRGKLNRLRG